MSQWYPCLFGDWAFLAYFTGLSSERSPRRYTEWPKVLRQPCLGQRGSEWCRATQAAVKHSRSFGEYFKWYQSLLMDIMPQKE